MSTALADTNANVVDGRQSNTQSNASLWAYVECATLLESAMRRCCLSPSWHHALGHTRLQHTTVDEKEARAREAARAKQALSEQQRADPEDDSGDVVWVKYTRMNGGPPRHALWKQRDEWYRVNGIGEFGGWQWVRCGRIVRKATADPATIVRRRQRLETVMQALMNVRREQDAAPLLEVRRKCYSPSCRDARSLAAADDSKLKCYRLVLRMCLVYSALIL
jgi:hypothetical protein